MLDAVEVPLTDRVEETEEVTVVDIVDDPESLTVLVAVLDTVLVCVVLGDVTSQLINVPFWYESRRSLIVVGAASHGESPVLMKRNDPPA